MAKNLYQGTRHDRLEHFQRLGRRCDGNTRTCINKAVEEYELLRVDADGNVVDDRPLKRKSCGRHRAQFLLNGLLRHVSTTKLADRPTSGRPAA